ncbi:penicillin-binding protein activator LpoB [Caballeronia grimmiae]|uniref:penicillin-binding protein activator LpoB n=1 Tax=Caballeronia grimmiae TaxID=1071679 RepID=UPI0038B7D7D4
MRLSRRLEAALLTTYAVLALNACAVVDHSDTAAAALDKNASWAVLPIANRTETPQAGLRASAIAQSLLTSNGIQLTRYPDTGDEETLFDTAKPDANAKALAWARSQNVRYALTGTVTEWRYKVGVDGEPAVGLTFDVVDVASGKVVWSAAGSRTGWSRDALSGVAQKLEKSLLGALTK